MPKLTDKELKVLEDHLGSEKLMVNKFRSYAAMTADPQIRCQCEHIATRHQNHFNRLIGFLG